MSWVNFIGLAVDALRSRYCWIVNQRMFVMMLLNLLQYNKDYFILKMNDLNNYGLFLKHENVLQCSARRDYKQRFHIGYNLQLIAVDFRAAQHQL